MKKQTFDIVFNDNENSNEKGFSSSLQYCKNYIRLNAGTNDSYFADYKGGTASIVNNTTGETVGIYSVDSGKLLAKK